MTHVTRIGTLLLFSATAASAQAVVGRSEASYTIREQLASGERLRVTSPNGEINIAQGSGSEVEIVAEKRVERRGDVTDIGFKVRKTSGGLIVCAVRDDDDDCDLERGYQQSRKRYPGWNSPRVQFTVRMPAGVRVTAETGNGDLTITGAGDEVSAHTGNGRVLISGTSGSVSVVTGNGRITVEGARGPVNARTGNGDVRVATSSGPVTAKSGNGDIDVSMTRLASSESMTFQTGSGRIVVALPDGFGAELESNTGNGAISTDFPIRVEGKVTRNRLRGTLGNGGERLALNTGNGDIEIRRVR